MKTKIISSLMTFALLLTITITNAQWSLTGNANTTPPSNFIGTTTGQALIFKTNNAEWMQIMTSGNVRIGTSTSTPNATPKLFFNDLNSTATYNGTGYDGMSWYSPDPLSFGIYKTSGTWAAPTYQQLKISWVQGIILNPGISNATNKAYVDIQGGGLRVITGNVGIGTTLVSNPNNYRLAVNGTIGAKEIKVEMSSTTWPDYVFETKYKLKSIKDLEAFIKVNKHLPNVPSAEETEKDGINLVKMDATLLEKIEELSLYIIELNKKIEAQNTRIELLIKQ